VKLEKETKSRNYVILVVLLGVLVFLLVR